MSSQPSGWWVPRHSFILLGFLGFANIYAIRVNLSIAIVSMVNHTSIGYNNTTDAEVCPTDVVDDSDANLSQDGEFNWNEYDQGIILGSFYWGYIMTQIPGGRMAEIFGARKLFGYGILSSSLLTLLSPIATRFNWVFFVILRVLMGIGEGVTFPAMHCMLAERASSSDRSRMATYIFTGAQFGSVIAFPLSGLLCQYGFDGGWPTPFYVLGSLGVIWWGFWMLLISDTPRANEIQANRETPTKRRCVPWHSIATSKAVWAVGAANIGYSWGYYTLMTELPTFFNNILHFDMKKNSLLSALPYLTMWLFSILCSIVADRLISRTGCEGAKVRKIFNSIGQYGPAIALIGVGFIGCNTELAVTLLTIAVGLSGACFSGFQVNFVEIAPPYAGTLFGVTNTLANVSGFVAPYIVGLLLHEEHSIGQWRFVFMIASLVYLVSNTIFILYGSSKVEPWAQENFSQGDDTQQQLTSLVDK